MTSFLLLVSFLLHLIIMIAVYQLYQQFQYLKEKQHQQLQEVLDSFLKKIQAENQKLESQINHNGHLYQDLNIANDDMVQDSKKNDNTLIENSTILKDLKKSTKNDHAEVSIKGQILSLAAEGKSISEIAKIVNRGKTEVELLLKMNNK